MLKPLLLAILLAILVGHLTARPQCIDDYGHSVDWYIVYKPPHLPDNDAFTGHRYAYLSSSSPSKWQLSSNQIDQPGSIFGKTLEQVYKSGKVSTVFYNDQPPSDKKVGSEFAHAKGILAGDEKQGFWLIHSVPKFGSPKSPYEYPDTGSRNGQSALCISLSVDQLTQVVSQNLLTSRPYVYHSSTGSGDSKFNEAIKQLQDAKWRSSGSYADTQLSSLAGVSFRSFYKSPGDHVDLYADIVAPAFKDILLVETWRRGKGTNLSPSCKRKATRVENVHAIKIAFDAALSGKFSYLNDHSKWAISGFNSSANHVCIGDINRMKSQFKRGGGTTCFSMASAWDAFQLMVVEVECC